MAYDVLRKRIVLFGGRDANGANPADTTWEFDGHTWTNLTPASGPVPREVAALAYDEARQQVVLFGGGFAGSSGSLADTWTWNGAQWTQQFPQQSPANRFGHAMAYDPAGARVLMFGGTHSGGFGNDLWQWDGANWTALVPSSSLPVGRHYHAIAFDPTRDQLLLFGGNPGSYQPHVGDTWTWSSNAWAQAVPSPSPSARSYPALVFDSVRREFVLFGGAEGSGTGPQGNPTDTWIYKSDEAWFATFGAGCPGSHNETPALSAGGGTPPVLGQTFGLKVSQLPLLTLVAAFMGTSMVNDGPTSLPRDLTGIGMTGCTQWVSIVQVRVLLGVGGRAQWRITIPNTASLLGSRSYYQALVLDWTANPLGVTISNAAAATIAGEGPGQPPSRSNSISRARW
jgi:hypothetical protein